MTIENAIRILSDAGASLELVRHDLLEYTEWRRDNVSKLDAELTDTEPFRCFREGWLFTGDGGGRVMGGLCGEWAANQLLSRSSPETIIASAQSELVKNASQLFDVSPVFGAKLEREIVLEEGVTLIPAGQVPLEWQAFNVMENFARSPFDRRDSCVLRQDCVVSPAFVARASASEQVSVESATMPTDAQRRAMRVKVRAAMLLCCNSAIEFMVTTRLGSLESLFAVRGERFGTTGAIQTRASVVIDEDRFRRNFAALGAFKDPDALVRATDRLGRARLGTNPMDIALDLGIAAEVLFMHGASSSNTEITYKLASRAAWLLGCTVADRIATFNATRDLYKARSDAVHSGKLSSRMTFDSQRSDELVRAAIRAVLLRGDFPDWQALTLGTGIDGGSSD